MQLNVFLFPSCYPIIWLVTIVEWEWFRSLWQVFITVWVPIVEIYPSFHWGSEGQEVSRISPIATQTAINKEIRSIYCTHGGHLELQSLFPEMNALGHYYDSPKWLKGNPYWEKYVGCHCWLSSENARLLAGSGFHAFYITACSFRTCVLTCSQSVMENEQKPMDLTNSQATSIFRRRRQQSQSLYSPSTGFL